MHPDFPQDLLHTPLLSVNRIREKKQFTLCAKFTIDFIRLSG